jgi:hypothetical protein
MATYANKTEVSSDRSRQEIERTLARWGADSFAYMTSRGHAQVAFEYDRKRIRFVLPLPDRLSAEFARTPTGRPRARAAADEAYEQAVRQKWRALSLVVKAKLEAVESGISTFEQEFYANLVLPNGQTVFEATMPQIARAIDAGDRGPLMLEAL